MRPALVGLSAAALVAAGCSSDSARSAAPRDCGRYELAHGPSSAADRERNRCLLEALDAGEAARLIVTRATIEGDPITTAYEARAGGSIELVVDTTQDRYGPQAVSRLRCDALRETAGVLEGSGCERLS